MPVLDIVRENVSPIQLSNGAAAAEIVRDSSVQAVDAINTSDPMVKPREAPKHSEQQQQQQQQVRQDARCDGAKATARRESKQGETLLNEGSGGDTYGDTYGEESGEDTVSEDEAEHGSILNVSNMMEDNSGTVDGIGNPGVEVFGTGVIPSSVPLDPSGSTWQQEKSREGGVSRMELDEGSSVSATKVEFEQHACKPAATDEPLAK